MRVHIEMLGFRRRSARGTLRAQPFLEHEKKAVLYNNIRANEGFSRVPAAVSRVRVRVPRVSVCGVKRIHRTCNFECAC